MAYGNNAVCRGYALEVYSLNKVSYSYKGGKKALEEVSLSVSKGESLTIIGTNGSGKSTLLYILNALLTPDSGEIKAFGKPLNGGIEEFRKRVSLLFQNPQVQLFSLSVLDELCFGPLQIGLSHDDTEKRASDILKLMGIEHIKDRVPWSLSGGEMKKVALGTCLSINPDVILLDEPITGLDPRSQVEFVDIINSLRNAGKTIITATHDLGIIEDISDRTVVFGEDHRVLFAGKPWDVMKNTGALLHANLIHKHIHRHSWYMHEHSHSGMHEHEHVPEIIQPYDSQSAGKNTNADETAEGTSDMEKLKLLVEHWMEHNHEHADTYNQWAEKAGHTGNIRLADALKKIADETEKMNGLFETAKKAINEKKSF